MQRANRPAGKARTRGGAPRAAWLAMAAAVALPMVVIAPHMIVRVATIARRRSVIGQVSPAPVAIVLGAGLRDDGSLMPILTRRMQAGVALYQAGIVERLLLSGDGVSRPEYDEVQAMASYAVAHGVNPQAVLCDTMGVSTYESCRRAYTIFGTRRAVIVTDGFHLPRAMYTAQRLGIEASGLRYETLACYPTYAVLWYVLRETAAIWKAMWQLEIAPAPPPAEPSRQRSGWSARRRRILRRLGTAVVVLLRRRQGGEQHRRG
jgi:vancomycin permeability regulator SanA